MSPERINLSPLQDIHAANIYFYESQQAFGVREYEVLLEGTDLSLDPFTGKIESEDGQEYDNLTDVAMEAEQLLARDIDGNLALDSVDGNPQFLRKAAEIMEQRFATFAANLRKLDSLLRFLPTNEAVESYRMTLSADGAERSGYDGRDLMGLMIDVQRKVGSNSEFIPFIFESLNRGALWAIKGDINDAFIEEYKNYSMLELGAAIRDDVVSGKIPIQSLHKLIHSSPDQRCHNAIGLMYYLVKGKTSAGPFGDFIKKNFIEGQFNSDNRSPHFGGLLYNYVRKNCSEGEQAWAREIFSDFVGPYDVNLDPLHSLIQKDPQIDAWLSNLQNQEGSSSSPQKDSLNDGSLLAPLNQEGSSPPSQKYY